jgi:hypothetical protein
VTCENSLVIAHIFCMYLIFMMLIHLCYLIILSLASDDGSTGMEVAIKMALRLWDIRTKKGLIKSSKITSNSTDKDDLNEEDMKNVIVLTQKDCYHGST